ncbi:glycosyltransferase, partial [Acidisphaera rubrifaciens]|uniref:glycosyltransferase n=1 Tax=Acidisphaera rubrifaciens TaxID=50715 RepID=UPI00066297D5
DRLLRLQAARQAAASGRLRVVYVSGEPHTPGHVYRVARFADAARMADAEVEVIDAADLHRRFDRLVGSDVVIIWRADWSATLERAIRLMRANGTRIFYDIDDLMFDRALATVEVIDGIRSVGLDTDETAALFDRVLLAMAYTDGCTCTTEELAYQVRRKRMPSYVLPNGFDTAAHARSRLAVRRRRATGGDGLIRIGYAGGSRTHQRDFAIVAGPVARVLAARPDCRLVLFHDVAYDRPLIDVAEFPALHARAHQIEWRDTVPTDALPDELARFDINLAPLEAGNPFCEAKSEIKIFEAALVEVPTIASPTGPFRRAVRDGETGLLAADEDAFHAALIRLLDDPALRRRLAHAAYLDALWRWGPERRAQLLFAFFDQMRGGRRAAQAFDLERRRAAEPPSPPPALGDAETVFARDALGEAAVTVVVPLYNYAAYVEEALDSVAAQTEAVIDLVIVDDASTDASPAIVRAWADRHAGRFNRLLVLRHRVNGGLGRARNSGVDAAETPYVLLLDADNRLRPHCAARLLAAARDSGASFAYPAIETFGAERDVRTAQWFQAQKLAGGNYVDAMALVARPAWAAAGGFAAMEPMGWEDYDFWCRCAEKGLWGIAVTEVLADYRVHGQSMLRVTTNVPARKLALVADMEARHPWLHIPPPE